MITRKKSQIMKRSFCRRVLAGAMSVLMTAGSVLGAPMSVMAGTSMSSNVPVPAKSSSVKWSSSGEKVSVDLDARATYLAAKEALYQGETVDGSFRDLLADLTDEDGYVFAGDMDLYEVALPSELNEALGEDAFLRVFYFARSV